MSSPRWSNINKYNYIVSFIHSYGNARLTVLLTYLAGIYYTKKTIWGIETCGEQEDNGQVGVDYIALTWAAPTFAAPTFEVNPNKSYLVVAATVVDENEKQPMWIGLGQRENAVHIPADEYIVSIRPGFYNFNHIDFQRNENSGRGTIVLKQERGFHFEAGKAPS